MTSLFRATAAVCGIYGTVLTLSSLLGLIVPCSGSANYCRESKKTAANALVLSLVPFGAASALIVASELKRGY